MSETKREFPELEVRRWEGEQWPDKRISIVSADHSGWNLARAMFINTRYADLDEAEEQATEIARRCNNWDGLIDAAKTLIAAIEEAPVGEDYYDEHLECPILELQSWVKWEEEK